MEQTHYRIRVKERNNSHIVETEFIGNKSRRYIIDFFGLEQPDVESYTIQIAGTPHIYGHKKAVQG